MLDGKIRPGVNGFFQDDQGRQVQLKGINADAGSKFPAEPYFPSHRPIVDGDGDIFYDGDHVSFVGRPWPISEVEHHILRIKGMGYNSIRYIFTWEAIEHEGPGIYDEEFINYTVEVLKIIDRIGGVYVYLDPHQDVWSRHCGGDGAPMWTLYAAGFDPKNFEVTEAAKIENHFPQDPNAYPKMLWTTNYRRLATATMFTLFFAGKVLAPKCIINGVNIQDFLQTHFIDSLGHLTKRIKEIAPFLLEKTVIGIETMNEPNSGYLFTPDITKIPADYPLRIDTCPTIFESLKLGMGIPVEVDEYKIAITGPKKIGSKFVDPNGVIAWIETDEFDKHYGFKRDPGWKLGECLWAQHGVWDIDAEEPLITDYFAHSQDSNIVFSEHYFANTIFIDFFKLFKTTIRNIKDDFLLFLQPPPLQIPPELKGTDIVDDNIVFCPHYYDGMSLMFKTWNKLYNVNTLGVIRGRYSNPVFGMVFGEGAIRRSFKAQLLEMKLESQDLLGENIPVIFSEIGMPFDMDDKKAYDEENFSSQTSALDALSFALESSNISHSWWSYTADNCHKWGDRFNCEDFSFWSNDDDISDDLLINSRSTSNNDESKKLLSKISQHQVSLSAGSSDTDGTNTLVGSSADEKPFVTYKSKVYNRDSSSYKPHEGIRAVDAVIRPYAIAVNGEFIDSFFELDKLSFTLKLKGSSDTSKSTKIYLPLWHFDYEDIKFDLSSGTVNLNEEKEFIEWNHGSSEETIVITNVGEVPRSKSIWKVLSDCLPCF